ncbi:MAG: hypothetical protein JWO69_2017 [Thermoleophilia bacterium]|nr:hypothetical protein [Thermoleophilia bacterium]
MAADLLRSELASARAELSGVYELLRLSIAENVRRNRETRPMTETRIWRRKFWTEPVTLPGYELLGFALGGYGLGLALWWLS